jgi:hypothetical protein
LPARPRRSALEPVVGEEPVRPRQGAGAGARSRASVVIGPSPLRRSRYCFRASRQHALTQPKRPPTNPGRFIQICHKQFGDLGPPAAQGNGRRIVHASRRNDVEPEVEVVEH